MLPPIVAAIPENGPQNGVRNPLGSSAALSAAHVTPAPTRTPLSATAIRELQEKFGFDNLYNLDGGILAYLEHIPAQDTPANVKRPA